MEIRCEECAHLGPAASVEPIEAGVGLVCSQCGHINAVVMGSMTAATADATEDSLVEGVSSEGTDGVTTSGEPRRNVLHGESMARAEERTETERQRILARLLPETGEGPRCRKCLVLLVPTDEHCRRCGLRVDQGHNLRRGEEPWERVPPGKEAIVEQATLLWASIEEDGHAEKMGDFFNLVKEEGVIDFGLRRFQHYLIAHPENAQARDALVGLALLLEKKASVARSQAEVSAEGFTDEVKRFRSRLMAGTLLFWLAILLLLSFGFWDKF